MTYEEALERDEDGDEDKDEDEKNVTTENGAAGGESIKIESKDRL